MLQERQAFNLLVMEQLQENIRLNRWLEGEADLLIQIAHLLAKCFQEGNKVLLFGNGGSAADAQHIAAEFIGKLNRERKPLPAVALTTDTSALTAISNDYGYEAVFARQLAGLVSTGDVVIGLSTSGRSINVINAMEEAKRLGAVTVAFTGAGGELREAADYALSIPSTNTPRIQEAHTTAGHIICHLVDEIILGDDS